MKNKFVIKTVSLTLILSLSISLFSSCKKTQTNSGLISSVTAEKKVGEYIARDTEFTVKTTSQTDKDALKKSIRVYPDSEYTLSGSGSEYSLKFKSTLMPDRLYRISSVSNDRTVYEWAFQTAKSFEITNVSLPEKIADKAIKFTFSHDDVNNFEENFEISPSVEGSFSRNKNEWTYTAKNQLMPETTYTVTLKKDTASDTGFSLGEDYSVSFMTAQPTGSFASIVRNSDDYSESYTANEAPCVLIKSRGLKDKNVKASVYQFSDYNAYLQAHQTYFSAPDFSRIDELLSGLTKNSEFTTKLDEYKSNDYPNVKSDLSQDILVYPTVLPIGYYITQIEVGGFKIYHVFQVSNICAYSLVSGNTLGVWVNDTKTQRQTVDNDVLLDNDYDELTNENGMAIFSLKKDITGSHYAIISNPSYPNFPLVSYISISSEYDEARTLSNYNCAVYTDSDSYSEGGQITVFGLVSPLGDADAAKDVTLSYNGHDLEVSPDKNGAFKEKITPYSHFSGDLTLLLKVNGVVTAQKTVKIGNADAKSPKKTDDLFMKGTLQGKTLNLECYEVSSSADFAGKNQSVSLDFSASDYYGSQLYRGDYADSDYTVETIQHTLFEKKQSGEYYDFASRSYKPCYEYHRNEKQKSVAKVSGKTQNGKAMVLVSTENDAAKGIYYSYKVTFTRKNGKTAVANISGEFDQNSSAVYNNSQYTLNFDKTEGLKSGESVTGKLTLGDDVITEGSVLCSANRFGLIKSKTYSADAVSLKFDGTFLSAVDITAAYFDGKHIYKLNSTSLKSSDEENKLNVNIAPDKQIYAKGDTVKLNVSVTDNSGSATSAPVLVCVYDSAKTQYSVNGSAFMNSAENSGYNSMDYIEESVSQYIFGRIHKPTLQKSDSSYSEQTGDKPIYFDYVNTDGSGKGSLSFTADSDTKLYMCSAAAFSGNKFGMAAVSVDSSLDTEIDIGVQKSISVYDELKVDVSSKNLSDIIKNERTQGGSADAFENAKNSSTSTQSTDSSKAADVTCSLDISLYRANTGEEQQFNEKSLVQKISRQIGSEQTEQISFGKLSVGKYALKAEYSVGDTKRTLTRYVNVENTKSKVLPTVSTIDRSAKLNRSDNTVTALIYSDEYSGVFDMAKQSYSGAENNMPTALAKAAAGRLFGVKSAADVKKYQIDGLCYEQSDNEDLLLSAAAVGISASGFDVDRLSDYFKNQLENDDVTVKLTALWGLGALHEPVLDRLNAYKNDSAKLSDLQRLYLALAFAYSGDFNSANELYSGIMGGYSDYKSGVIRTKGISDEDSTALTALLALKLNKHIGENLINYISGDEFTLKNNRLQYICIAEYIADYSVSSDERAKVTVTTGGESKDRYLQKSEFLKVEIKPENTADTEFSSNDKLNLCAVYLLSE